jgi:hypothetical protein
MSQEYELLSVDRLVVGTVGPPGQRVFYLQARQDRQLVTLKVEKAHIAELSNRLLAMIEEAGKLVQGGQHQQTAPLDLQMLQRGLGRAFETSAVPALDQTLETPLEADFVVGTLALAVDENTERVLLVANELVEEGEEGSIAHIGASVAQVAALARHGVELVAAGRPLCILCGYPIDPEGHACPRSNGHGPPTL